MRGGTGTMASTRYRRGRQYAADMAFYARMMAEDNSDQIHQLQQNLTRALQEDVTPRQRQVLFLYYDQRMTMKEIGAALGVDRSTVSRTMKRGENRLRRCLRYGGAALLGRTLPATPEKTENQGLTRQPHG
mgnify:CR=1 FL=1